MIPVLGWATAITWPVLGILGLIIWIVFLVKANGGNMYKHPVVGDIAEKQANAI
jgi:uncharacterized membrane protein